MDNSKHAFDYSCNSFSLKVDVFVNCEQDKGNVLMRQKQLIFQMMEYNLETKFQAQLGLLKGIYDLQTSQCLLVTEKFN